MGTVRRLEAGLFRLRDYILLDLNRYVLSLVFVAVGFGLFLQLELSGTINVGQNTTPLLYLFSALVGGNITLITIVISINQLILSRELRSPRELQTEMRAAAEYRNEVESETNRLVVPEKSAEFLRVLVTDTRTQAETLQAVGENVENASFMNSLNRLGQNVETELNETLDRLEQSRSGVFPALSTILDADFATHINHTRWLERAYADTTPETVQGHIDDLEQHLEQLDIARQYFKTIYIKQELADVSKLVMSSGIAAVIVAAVLLVFTGYQTAPLPSWQRLFLVPLAVTVNLVPLALLVSHVFRIATVARRTAAITPFLAPTE